MNKANIFKMTILTLCVNGAVACNPTQKSQDDIEPELKQEIKLLEEQGQTQSVQELSYIPFILDKKTSQEYVKSQAVRDSVDAYTHQMAKAMIAKYKQQQK